jgi:hypothetical protein
MNLGSCARLKDGWELCCKFFVLPAIFFATFAYGQNGGIDAVKEATPQRCTPLNYYSRRLRCELRNSRNGCRNLNQRTQRSLRSTVAPDGITSDYLAKPQSFLTSDPPQLKPSSSAESKWMTSISVGYVCSAPERRRRDQC